jgi:PKD repeat protein
MKAVFRHVSYWRITVAAAVVALGVLASPAAAYAQLSNDNFSNAAVISSLPFSDIVDNTTATTEPGEPSSCSSPPVQQTVWYSITPASNMTLKVDMSGSDFSNTIFTVYQQTGAGLSGLSALICDTSSVNVRVFADITYYMQAGNNFGSGGLLHLNVQQIPPPVNDDFGNATVIAALPFSDTVDTSAATFEPGEPAPSCGFNPLAGSVWYSFTPATSESVSTSIDASFGTVDEIYAGTSFASLTAIRCNSGFSLSTIHVNAGTTYYFQVEGFGRAGQDGRLTFHLVATPPPTADFFFQPFDPSVFDTVQFFDISSDPGQAGFQAEAWNFGDGTTGTGSFPTHRYTADGDYTAELTVTTVDGRTASASQIVHVSTHDVVIAKFTVPTSASAGQTRSITVGVSDKRYPETVQVQLLKSNSAGGFDQVGTSTLPIPVQMGKATTPFTFNYTFTQDDGAVGKVTFEAIATIQGARDALPADNTAIASTTVH